MANLNFDNVETPVNNNAFKYVQKGAQKLTIVNIDEGQSATGTPFMDVRFRSERFDAEFSHKFYLTQNALPRVQALSVGFTGNKLSGNVDTDKLIPELIGKESNAIVDAVAVTKAKGDKSYVNEIPTLRYTNFASLTSEFKDEDARVEDKTTPADVQQAAGVANGTPLLDEKEDTLPW